MFLTIDVKDMYRNGLPTTRMTINVTQIIKIVDEPAGPAIYIVDGEPARATINYSALIEKLGRVTRVV